MGSGSFLSTHQNCLRFVFVSITFFPLILKDPWLPGIYCGAPVKKQTGRAAPARPGVCLGYIFPTPGPFVWAGVFEEKSFNGPLRNK